MTPTITTPHHCYCLQLALVIDRNGDGVADVVRPIIRGLEMPAGVAWYKGALFVSGNLKGKGYVWRVDNIDSYAESGKVGGGAPHGNTAGRQRLYYSRW
jgi:hypothetical protein